MPTSAIAARRLDQRFGGRTGLALQHVRPQRSVALGKLLLQRRQGFGFRQRDFAARLLERLAVFADHIEKLLGIKIELSGRAHSFADLERALA